MLDWNKLKKIEEIVSKYKVSKHYVRLSILKGCRIIKEIKEQTR